MESNKPVASAGYLICMNFEVFVVFCEPYQIFDDLMYKETRKEGGM
ncbi:hypothetical protein SAMN05661091_3049 [Paenibacillus uliginis N3/975]|uniref:Uncharacterized protein n=1 Tax=Paenibacillus uliginis N3/975 TaxID=1313296 RepID=A0A1X7HF62_9BACL|nr:hypothetical protein SAMN05661091_3049 [Paenibacillus uliginis N3/975]